MGLIGAVLGAFFVIVAAFASRVIADEFKAWTPWIVRRLINNAVRRLPRCQQERYAEEWSSHANEVPGEVGKLITALGFVEASWKMTPDLGQEIPFALFKRLFDICLSATMLILLAPLLVMCSAFIISGSRGNPICVSLRRGYKNKTMSMYRFRSVDTKAGRLMGRTYMLELPQLFNVFLGDMSFVGPRPKPVEQAPLSDSKADQQFEVKPGLTGWAQIHSEGFKRRFELDAWYAQHRSIWLDLKIMMWTLSLGVRRVDKGPDK